LYKNEPFNILPVIYVVILISVVAVYVDFSEQLRPAHTCVPTPCTEMFDDAYGDSRGTGNLICFVPFLNPPATKNVMGLLPKASEHQEKTIEFASPSSSVTVPELNEYEISETLCAVDVWSPESALRVFPVFIITLFPTPLFTSVMRETRDGFLPLLMFNNFTNAMIVFLN